MLAADYAECCVHGGINHITACQSALHAALTSHFSRVMFSISSLGPFYVCIDLSWSLDTAHNEYQCPVWSTLSELVLLYYAIDDASTNSLAFHEFSVLAFLWFSKSSQQFGNVRKSCVCCSTAEKCFTLVWEFDVIVELESELNPGFLENDISEQSLQIPPSIIHFWGDLFLI